MVTAFFVVLSVALVILLVRQITLSDIRRLAGQLTAAQFLFLSGLYLLMAYCRGIRIGYVIQDGNHARMTSIAAMHAFLNHVLPFRLGELSLPFLIKAFTARGLASGSLSLVVIRLYDAVSIALLSVMVCAAMFLSGALTLGREYVSDYQLIDADQVAAADYVKENAAPDATFLTYNNHNNCIAALTGRNIVCGSGSYLYFHGIDYSARENALHLLYEQPSTYFSAYAKQYDIDYVFIGSSELANYQIDLGYFADNFPVFYQNGSVTIYSVHS